jgi:hypothetical protein
MSQVDLIFFPTTHSRRDFIDALCRRLNLRLSETGQLSVLQLVKQWDLPTELLHGHVLTEVGVGRRVHAVRFEDSLYTASFFDGLKRRLGAILVAITRYFALCTRFFVIYIYIYI